MDKKVKSLKDNRLITAQRMWTSRIRIAGFKNNLEFCESIGLHIDVFRDYTWGDKLCPPERRKMIESAIKVGNKTV